MSQRIAEVRQRIEQEKSDFGEQDKCLIEAPLSAASATAFSEKQALLRRKSLTERLSKSQLDTLHRLAREKAVQIMYGKRELLKILANVAKARRDDSEAATLDYGNMRRMVNSPIEIDEDSPEYEEGLREVEKLSDTSVANLFEWIGSRIRLILLDISSRNRQNKKRVDSE